MEMFNLTKYILVLIFLAPSHLAFGQEVITNKADEHKISDVESSPYKEIIQMQLDLLEKILKIQEQTLLLLKKSEDSRTQIKSEKLLKDVSIIKKNMEQTKDEVNKVSNNSNLNKAGTTVKIFTFSQEEDVESP
jgi:hypothetical protein